MGEATVLRERLVGEGLDPGAWSNGPGDRYDSHDHGYDKVIVVASGSITFGLDDGPTELTEGDRLELPAATSHDAIVGGSGVVCLEAHLPAGTFTTAARREAGSW
ncbi:MAG TPA: cupin [Methylomirabilota bacterium]|nr:cupin [Methylomirabilota bacterium]